MGGHHRGPPLTAPRTVVVPTSAGDARLSLYADPDARALVCLGHGAGGGVDAPDLVAVRERLRAGLPGVAVALVEQPYRVQGRRAPVTSAVKLDAAFTGAVEAARELVGEVPLLVGGRSAGARVACRTARSLRAVGVVALAFPLHPPGRRERSRLDELVGAGVPTLVVQGERDAFGRPEELTAASVPAATLVQAVPGDHGLRTDLDAVATAVSSWVERLLDREGQLLA